MRIFVYIYICAYQIMALGTPRNSRNTQDIECICVTICGISIVDVDPNGTSLCCNCLPHPALSAEEFQKRQVLQTKRLWGNLVIWVLDMHMNQHGKFVECIIGLLYIYIISTHIYYIRLYRASFDMSACTWWAPL